MDTSAIDKMKQVKDEAQVIGEFLEWLQTTKNLVLAEWQDEIGSFCNWRSSITYRSSKDKGTYSIHCQSGQQVRVYYRHDIADELTDNKCPNDCEDGIFITQRDEPILLPAATRGIERLLAEYFDIDLDAVEREKLQILKELREKD